MNITIPKTLFFELFLICFLIAFSSSSSAQEVKKEKWSLFKDTLDHKLDLTKYIIDAKGLVPIPYLITEPALGGFGGAMAALYLSPKKRPLGYEGYIPPDITAGFAMYTANNSWAGGLLRIGSFPEIGVKYRVGAAYVDINLNFYHESDIVGTKKLEFNIKSIPLLLSVSKKILNKDLYLGAQYLYADNTLKPNFTESLPGYISSKEMNGKMGSLGSFLEYDNTKTIFTPNRGIKMNLLYSIDENWTGSDYSFQEVHGYFNWFLPIKSNWVSGLHLDFQQAYGDTPFYLKPFVILEGIPAARYQGNSVYVIETEQRFDVSYRWSIVGFGGLGKTIDKNQNFNSGTTVYNYGTGFRYFLARAFNLRAGIDIAKGPDSWGYYIVFGHKWNR